MGAIGRMSGGKHPGCTPGGSSGSELRLFGEGQCIFDIHAQVVDRALDLGMPEQDLYGPQIAGLLVDDRSLGPGQGMSSIILRS